MTDESTELTTVEPSTPPSQALTDLRSQAMATMSPEAMQQGLSQYAECRRTLRVWLLEQMQQGVHYGVPPGCEPKTEMRNGVLHVGVWFKGRNGGRGEYRWFPETQWKPKPSLYKAGADFVCDTMELVDVYDADMDAWQQLGSPKGTFVFRCRLYPKGVAQIPENLVGEGRGVRRTGQKGGDDNNAIKMAKKCAKVDAVLNGYGLSDLFTQDLEDLRPQPHDNPEQAAGAPQVPGRGDRADQPTVDELTALVGRWKAMCADTHRPDSKEAWGEFVENTTEGQILRANANNSGSWTRGIYEACDAEIVRLKGGSGE